MKSDPSARADSRFSDAKEPHAPTTYRFTA
jgi:hypothetical protein